MFDIAPSEFLILAVVALVFIGPKDLPKVMRVVGRWVGKARGMANHFRSGLDEMMRQSELDELEKKWKEENERIMREHPLAAPFDTLDTSPAAAAAAPLPGPLMTEGQAEGPALAPPAELPPAEPKPLEPQPWQARPVEPHPPEPQLFEEPDPAAPELPLPPGDSSRRALP